MNHNARFANGTLAHTPELDGIRGWACLSVLIAHCVIGVLKPEGGTYLSTFVDSTLGLFLGGVDLFFVLSGFLIGGILLDSRDKPNYFSNFWIRRIARIFPVAYLLLFTYIVALFVCNEFNITRFDNWLLAEPRPPIWTYATFTQSIPIAFGGYGGPRWMGITWSLAIEEQFYLLFPFAVFFFRRKYIVALVIFGIIIAPVLRHVLDIVFGGWYAPYVLLPSRVDGLMYGVAIALIIRNPAAFDFAVRFRRVFDAVAILIFCMYMAQYRYTFWPGPSGFSPVYQSAAAIMWAIVVLRIFTFENSLFNGIWRNKVLTWLGLISYGLYMYHQTVNGLVHSFLFDQEPTITTLPHFLAALGIMATALTLAALSYRFYEAPIRKLGHKLASRVTERSPPHLRVHEAP